MRQHRSKLLKSLNPERTVSEYLGLGGSIVNMFTALKGSQFYFYSDAARKKLSAYAKPKGADQLRSNWEPGG